MESQHQDVMGLLRPLPLREPATTFSQVIDTQGCVRAHGDLTRRTADQLRRTVEALRRSGLSHLVVDLRGLRSMDEAGLCAVEATRAAIGADGGRLTVLAPPDEAGRLQRVIPPRQ